MNDQFALTPKSDDDIMMGKEGVDKIGKVFQLNAEVDWDAVYNAFKNVSRGQLSSSIADALFQSKSRIPDTVLSRYVDTTSREKYIQSTFLELMSTPEYQLC